MLECEDWEPSRTYFKFENMWLRVVTPDFRPLKTDIRRRNREVFGNLEDNKSRILEELTINEQAETGSN